MRKAILFNNFAAKCPFLVTGVTVNNGYGCTHKDQKERDRGQGKCFCWSCPLGYPADDESLEETDIEWVDGKPGEGELEEDSYIIVETESMDSVDKLTEDNWNPINTAPSYADIYLRCQLMMDEYICIGQVNTERMSRVKSNVDPDVFFRSKVLGWKPLNLEMAEVRSVLKSGTVFEAVDGLNHRYCYVFSGIKLDDSTGCSYIRLYNRTLDTWTDVEYAWFTERKITILKSIYERTLA